MLDFTKVKTYPISSRKNLESLGVLDIPRNPITSDDLVELAAHIKRARKQGLPVMFMIGGHVIKTGMSPYIIDLIKRNIITHVASNGAASIHDFELAYQGGTSEDVAKSIEDGSFGMADETGRFINEAINEDPLAGYGFQVGKMIDEKDLRFKEASIQCQCYKHNIPYSVHVAIGTDITHQHPIADGACIGRASFEDFHKFTQTVSRGGCFLNFGSAVIMPEVFLKAVSISRNLGNPIPDLITANFDQIDHYRPRMNIVQRPTSKGGKGYNFIGKHQNLIPSLWMLLKD